MSTPRPTNKPTLAPTREPSSAPTTFEVPTAYPTAAPIHEDDDWFDVFSSASREMGGAGNAHAGKTAETVVAMRVLQHASSLPVSERTHLRQEVKSLIKRRVEGQDGEPAFLAQFEEMHPLPP
jgi:hypothetical protein